MNKIFTLCSLLGATQAATQARACQEPDVVQNFDINAYLGRWYEIVRDVDTTYEHGICSVPNYSLKEDGDIRVRNNEFYPETQQWGGGTGNAFVVDPSKDEGYL